MGGESLVVVRDDDLVKVHVHTLKPGDALNIGQRYGEFVKLKIENIQQQHSTIVANAHKDARPTITNRPAKKNGIITVAAGEGLTKLFYDLKVDKVISGGQTMNPSTQDFVKEINDLKNCQNIFIFPNNSNIILAAQQAKDVLSDRNIYVIETKSIQAGLSAVGMFNALAEPEVIIQELEEVISNVDASSITYAIKDTTFEGVQVNEGDYMAIANKGIISAGKNRKEVFIKLIDTLLSDTDKELLTVIYGEDVEVDEIGELQEYIESNYDVECEIIDGGQPVYSYLIGLE